MIAFGITKVAALAYLMFNLFTPPCFAAIGAMNAEMKSAKWLWGGIGLQLSVGFTVGYLVHTVGTLIVDASKLNVIGAIAGLIAVLVIACIVLLLIRNTNKKLAAEAARKAA
jgi:ferrous iron transport protein B